MSEGRHGAPARGGAFRRGVLAIVGVGLLGFGVYWAVGAVRIFLEPTARVRLDCVVGRRDHGCPASWTIDGRTVRGTASDPYSGHRYSRFIDHPPDAVLTMHVSGNQARMTPATSAVVVAVVFPLWGLGMMLAPVWHLIPPRRSANA